MEEKREKEWKKEENSLSAPARENLLFNKILWKYMFTQAGPPQNIKKVALKLLLSTQSREMETHIL